MGIKKNKLPQKKRHTVNAIIFKNFLFEDRLTNERKLPAPIFILFISIQRPLFFFLLVGYIYFYHESRQKKKQKQGSSLYNMLPHICL